MTSKEKLKSLLINNNPQVQPVQQEPYQLKPYEWVQIRLFLSSSTIDTHAERDLLIKKVIPAINNELKDSFIVIIPIDLRWGVFGERSTGCHAIQKTCLSEIDRCRHTEGEYPYFLGIRTDRYGWAQDEYRQPDQYDEKYQEGFAWVPVIEASGKQLSITSLECIHACYPMSKETQSINQFFYKRQITNADDIEEQFRWIWEFEFKGESEFEKISDDLKKQYIKTSRAAEYQEDKDELDEYLRSLPHVKYMDYTCQYKIGSSKITGSDGRKNFGIGFVENLEELEEMVRTDLLNAIRANFIPADLSTVPKHELVNFPYENAMREKASSFIGRTELIDPIYKHCTADSVAHSVMVVAGTPGQGKSALMARVATTCLDEARSKGNFLFVHAVDSCPQSNDLEQMLLRLHANLSIYAGEKKKLESMDDLREKHISRLEQVARAKLERRFVILIDAVNQLHEDGQSRSMWWIPTKDSPKNIRFVISTLLKENNTYANALKRCPEAAEVMVESMSRKDGEKMVETILATFNKKLTTDLNLGYLGNQMAVLLDKNLSPLYLSASCEALRTQGVFEKMSEYIRDLPATVPELFESLLNRWSTDYGAEFISYLVVIITLSRDGLMENMINKIMSFIEKEKKLDYECSFSTIYGAVRGFLSSGGGGNLRFFHDQVNIVVREKNLTPVFEAEAHKRLVDFYLNEIGPQLKCNPDEPAGPDYADCLRQVVYHQIELFKLMPGDVDFNATLRHIFFIRERLLAEQSDALQKEYCTLLGLLGNHPDARDAIEEWQSFTQIYSPHITQSPEWTLTMATNQLAFSNVYRDTLKLDAEVPTALHPIHWTNKPASSSSEMIKVYKRIEGLEGSNRDVYCFPSTVEGNAVALYYKDFYGKGNLYLYEMDTCTPIQTVKLDLEWPVEMAFTLDGSQLWVANHKDDGLHIRDVSTGKVIRKNVPVEGNIYWMQLIGEHMVCETSQNVVFVSLTTFEVTKQWSKGEGKDVPFRNRPQNNYMECYHEKLRWFITLHSHNAIINCFNADGVIEKTFDFEKRPWYKDADGYAWIGKVSVDPNNTDVLAVHCGFALDTSDYDRKEKYFIEQISLSSFEALSTSVEVSGVCKNVVSVHDGKRVVCAAPDDKTVLVVDSSGKLTNKLRGHTVHVRNIRRVPGTNQLLTSGEDGCYLFDVPLTPDADIDEEDSEADGEVVSCCFIGDGDHFIIIRDGVIEKWSTSSGKKIASSLMKGIEEISQVVEVPGKDVVIVNSVVGAGRKDSMIDNSEPRLLLLKTADLEPLNDKTIEHQILKRINYIAVSLDGSKCVVSGDKCAEVFDISDLQKVSLFATIPDACGEVDFHRDNSRLLLGSHVWNDDLVDVYMWNVENQQLTSFWNCDDNKSDGCFTVKFLYDPDRVFIVSLDGDDPFGLILTMSGEVLHKLKHPLYMYMGAKALMAVCVAFCEGRYVVTGNSDRSLQLYDINTGEHMYTFFYHSSSGFRCAAVHPTQNLVVAGNKSGQVFMLR